MKKPTWGGVSRLWAWTVCGLSVCLAPLGAGADAPRAYALVLPETTSAEGDVAVASVKSPAHVKPEVRLVIVAEFNPGEMPEGDGMVEQNVVIAVKSGVRLHTLHDLPEHVFPYFPGMNHAGLQALWGPEQEGNRFGLLCYSQKWGAAAVVAVDFGNEPESGSQLDLIQQLDTAVAKELAKKLKSPDEASRYVIGYVTESVDDPNGVLGIADPVSFNLGLRIEVPKSDDDPYFEGTVKITLQRDAKGKLLMRISGVVVTQKE